MLLAERPAHQENPARRGRGRVLWSPARERRQPTCRVRGDGSLNSEWSRRLRWRTRNPGVSPNIGCERTQRERSEPVSSPIGSEHTELAFPGRCRAQAPPMSIEVGARRRFLHMEVAVLDEHNDRRVTLLGRSVEVSERFPLWILLGGCALAAFLLVVVVTAG